MGYITRFSGQFDLDKPLTLEQYNTLVDFAKTDHRHDELSGMPGFWCDWIPTRDGKGIVYADRDTSFEPYTEWLSYIIERFLAPWGYTLNGSVRWQWQGAEISDTGILTVHNNVVSSVKDGDLLAVGRVYKLFLSLKDTRDYELCFYGNGSGQLQHIRTEQAYPWKSLEEAERILQEMNNHE